MNGRLAKSASVLSNVKAARRDVQAGERCARDVQEMCKRSARDVQKMYEQAERCAGSSATPVEKKTVTLRLLAHLLHISRTSLAHLSQPSHSTTRTFADFAKRPFIRLDLFLR